MHWLNMIMVAFLYAFVGSLIGVSYALLTGADMSSHSNIASFAALFGPALLLVLAAMRKLMRERDIPIARAIYHTLLITFAAPMLLYGAQLIAATADAPKVARSFEVLKFWSIPSVFIFAVMYGVWRIVLTNERIHASGTTGGPTSPTGDGGNRSSIAPTRDSAGDPPPGALRRVAEVLE